MSRIFLILINYIHKKYKLLKKSSKYKIKSIPKDCPVGGVYMFSVKGKVLYVGRTKRKISVRLKGHISNAGDCPLAWRMTKPTLGGEVSTYKKGERKIDYLKKRKVRHLYKAAKKRISNMNVQYIEEKDPFKRAILEIYTSFVTNSKYNEFKET